MARRCTIDHIDYVVYMIYGCTDSIGFMSWSVANLFLVDPAIY